MAITLRSLQGNTIIGDSSVDASVVKDVAGGATTLYEIYVNNNNTSAAAAWLKLYDNLAPTLGTTDPEFIFKIPAPTAANEGVFRFLLNLPTGVSFTNGLSYAATKEGGTTGTTSLAAVLEVEFITS